MKDANADGLDRLRALAAHVRDAESPPPDGVDARRIAVYRELFRNNIDTLLAGGFPVLRRILGDTAWPTLIGDFYAHFGARTPLFPELPREFLQYLPTRAERGLEDPPWLLELAHYEWIELALQLSDACVDGDVDADGDLLDAAPVLSPLAWPLAYEWPVTHLAPDFQPRLKPDAPTLLLLQRLEDGSVRFSTLTPLSFRLLQMLEEAPARSGRAQLQALAQEAGATEDAAFIDAGATMLAQFRRDGAIAGTRR